MRVADIRAIRLANQQLSVHTHTKPEDVVAHLGAVQSQDYPGALWAVAQRTPSATRADVERAIAERKIVRTWPMRGTLHFVAAPDVRWILHLLTPRIGSLNARERNLGLDARVIAHSTTLTRRALAGGMVLTRHEMYEMLERGGVKTAHQRGLHILWRMAHTMVTCFGPHKGKEATFVLLDDWVPHSKSLDRDEALQQLTLRYFTGHGPATVHDLNWWSGLTMADIKRGISMNGTKLISADVDGRTHWMASGASGKPDTATHMLPPFDEYLVGYKDRTAALHVSNHHKVIVAGNGMFSPVIVDHGEVVGTWRRQTTKAAVAVSLTAFAGHSAATKRRIKQAVSRYSHYLNTSVRYTG